MSKGTLYDKVWKKHVVGKLPDGRVQFFIGRHLMHEVTSPQAFEELRERKIKVKRPDLTYAILDHVIPTKCRTRPFKDKKAELMTATLESNVKQAKITYFGPGKGQGVCHVVFPEKGIIWPGQTGACGDSHTATHGAFGSIYLGIGTTQVRDLLATQTLALDPKKDKLKVKRINFEGNLQAGVSAKDLILYTINKLTVKGGNGFAYELSGSTVDNMSMEERMTMCNMGIEGGARVCYVNPDDTTFKYLLGREFAPKQDFRKAVQSWRKVASNKDAEYDSEVTINSSAVEPMVTWGTSPDQAVAVNQIVPCTKDGLGLIDPYEALDSCSYMNLIPGQNVNDIEINVAFIGSCTNGRLSDLEDAAKVLEGNKVKVKTLVVPGSEQVKYEAEMLGLDLIFKRAGAEWRNPGCSMCLAMSPDTLEGYNVTASTSNRPFKGRQGQETRTHLMSPAGVASSAIEGRIADPRPYLMRW